VTYNFDADAWFEREERLLRRRRDAGEISGVDFSAAIEQLEARYEEMVARLARSFELPGK
jgi:hypothetical protein